MNDGEGAGAPLVQAIARGLRVFSGWLGRKGPSRDEADTILLSGAYRLHRHADVERFTALAKAAFPSFEDRIRCFGADWLGRQFATDRARLQNGEPLILMLEPGTAEVLEIPATFASFHDTELVEHADAAVAVRFFEAWLAAGGQPPQYHQCVAYKAPLFLGGADELGNLQMSDLDVSWSIAAQLIARVRDLPDGTRIDQVRISD